MSICLFISPELTLGFSFRHKTPVLKYSLNYVPTFPLLSLLHPYCTPLSFFYGASFGFTICLVDPYNLF